MKKIPFLQLLPTYNELQIELDEAYHRVMSSGWYLCGEETEAFESEFADYCEVKHCITVGNGLDALRLILEALGIGKGDEVIVPSHTFIATWLAVTQVGATPIPVEPNEGFFNINPSQIEAVITSHTKAIVPVHLYGHPADMDPIICLAEKYRIKVVEDAAQAHGALYKGKKTGGLATAAGFSFYPGKNLGAFGDAGCVTTNNDDIAKHVKKFRNYGSDVRYHHELLGINSRMDELQAAFLRVKLTRLDEWNTRRKMLADAYLQDLVGIPGTILPCIMPWSQPVWHIFPWLVKKKEKMESHLKEHGISVINHYPIPPHLSPAYSYLGYRKGDFPIAERIASEEISLPIGPQLSPVDVAHIIKTIKMCSEFKPLLLD